MTDTKEHLAHGAGIPATARLRVANVHKSFPTPAEPLVVLRGVSLELCAGDSLSIVGPSGSGKSTLLNIIGTLDRPTAGSVWFGQTNLFELGDADRARFRAGQIGFVFQDHHLLPQCTALENVLLPRLALGSASSDDVTRARQLLERTGIAGRATHLPGELSGGERQRVAVARALMNGAAILLADEPTGNLDAGSADAVGELLCTIAVETRAILIVVTHSAELAQRFARRARMHNGQLLDDLKNS